MLYSKNLKTKIKKFTKIISLLTLAGLLLPSSVSAKETIKFGVIGEMVQVWEKVVADVEEKDGYKFELVEFSDFNTPNEALASGDLDLSATQAYRSMEMYNEESGNDLVAIAYTVLAPMGIYSNKHTDINDLPDGARVAIPSDSSSYSRALNLLQTAGLIKLDPNAKYPQEDDIVENPKNIEVFAVDSTQTASSLPDVDVALINVGMAVAAGLDPAKDPIFKEPVDESSKQYYNIIQCRSEDKDRPEFKGLLEAYKTEEVRKMIDEVYDGGAIAVNLEE